MRRSGLVFAVSAVLAGALLGWLMPGYIRTPEPPKAVRPLAGVPLTTHAGETVRVDDYRGKVLVLVVSVAPQRDTPGWLGGHVTAFHPRFVSMTGSPEVTRRVAAFGLTPGDPGAAPVMVLDQRGYLRLLFPFRISAPSLAEDLATLLRPVRS